MPSSRWTVVVAFALVGVATQVCWLAYAAVTTMAAGHYGVTDQAIGWLANIFPLLFVVLAVPAGFALDRWFRPTLAVGTVLLAVGAAVRTVFDTYDAALAGQVLAAVAQPILANAITRVAAGYLRPDDRPLGISIGAGATYVGMIVAIGIGTAIPYDVELVVGLGTGISVVTAVLALTALRVAPPFHGDRAPQVSVRAAWKVPAVPLLSVVVFLGMGVFVSLATWLEPLLTPAGIKADVVGMVMLAMLVAGVAGCALVPPRAARHRAERTALSLTGAVVGVACLLLAVAPAAVTGFVAAVPIGFLLLSALPVAFTLVERTDSAAAGTVTSLLWMVGNAGGLLLSFAVGYLLDTPWLAFGLFGALMLVALLFARRLQQGHDQAAGAQSHDASAPGSHAAVD
ncbi:MFS transporter [Alloactinosynnema sp. L-07]|uniref:MFS transporter n=1 Tax=Alloactinosynnema sp. L-07 TaxID=1653480 RepID=UPI00155F5BD8|nr:MFS transporter [Alloactinosynnema sp. L-07]